MRVAMQRHWAYRLFFFFNDPATTEIYTLSLHDALPISAGRRAGADAPARGTARRRAARPSGHGAAGQHRGRDGAQPGPQGHGVAADRGGRGARAGTDIPEMSLY